MPDQSTPSVIDSPELLAHIFSHLPVSECARLMTTSRPVFHEVVPRVWRNVPNVLCLLSLIPGIVVVPREKPNRKIVELPPFSGADFTRFFEYSLHVRELTTGQTDDFCTVRPWYTLLTATRNVPLLPNLHSLRLYDSYWTCDNQLLWIYAFASSSLRSVTTDSSFVVRGYDISDYTMSVILAHLKAVSPAIESLEIFSGLDHKAGEPDGQFTHLSLLQEEPFHVHLASFSNLSSFATITNTLTVEGLRALATLPKLASLDLSPIYGHPIQQDLGKTELPPRSFQALRRLGIHYIYMFDVYMLWDITPLVARLTTLELELEMCVSEELDPNLSAATKTFFMKLIQIICQRSRLISDLTLDWGGPDKVDYTARHIDAVTVCLATLRLRHLTIRRFINEADNLSQHDIITSGSHVRYLNIPEYAVNLKELSHIAALPRLEQLVVSLNREVDWEFSRLNPTCRSRSKRFHTLILTPGKFSLPQGDLSKDFAKYLVALWPKLQQVQWFQDRLRKRVASSFDNGIQFIRDKDEQTSLPLGLTTLNAHICDLRRESIFLR